MPSNRYGRTFSIVTLPTPAAAAPEGRVFFGEVQLVNARGTAAGVGSVKIEKVLP
jgi:hypothetical protein